jgi:hypothetical protein
MIRGVMWVGFDGLRDLNWWERAYLRGLSNYLAQSQAASGLVLTLRSFNHSIEHIAIVGDPSGLTEEDRKSIETMLMNLERSRTGWEMIGAKAREVMRMLSSSQPQEGNEWTVRLLEFSIRDALKHAWSLATDLGVLPHEFKEISSGKFKLDQCRDMTIAYGAGVKPDDDCVSGAIYAAATVILENARIHGKPPYLAWVAEISPQVRIIFGNGSTPPSEDKLRVPEAQMKFADRQHGVGLWFARRLLHTEGGSISLRGEPKKNEFDCIPDIAYKCKTFYEVIIEKGE